MCVIKYLDALESAVVKCIPSQEEKLITFSFLVEEAKSTALKAPWLLSSLDSREVVPKEKIYRKAPSSVQELDGISSAVNKHYVDWKKAIESIQTKEFVDRFGFECTVRKQKNKEGLKGYALVVIRAEREDSPIDEAIAKKICQPSVEGRVEYRTIDFYQDIGAKTFLQRVTPESLFIGSGKRLALLLLPVLPLLTDWVLELFSYSALFGFGFNITWIMLSLLFLMPIYLVMSKGISLTSIPFWLQPIFSHWEQCQIKKIESDRLDFLRKRVQEMRVVRVFAECEACTAEKKGEVDLYFSTFKPWKAVGKCSESMFDHQYSFTSSEKYGYRIRK